MHFLSIKIVNTGQMIKYIHLVILISLVALLSMGCSQNRNSKKEVNYESLIIGKWEGEQKGRKGAFIFKSNGEADMMVDGELLSESVDGVDDVYMTYHLKPEYDPMHLDLVMRSRTFEINQPIKMILVFYNDDQIQIRTDFSEVRPTDFTGAKDEETMILNRVIQ